MKVVIVGGVAGGATAAARIRRLDEKAEIVIFERTGNISYANCGLPYFIGDVITDPDALTLQSPEGFFRRFRIKAKIHHEVLEILPEKKTVIVKNLEKGNVFEENYDKLLLSPGAKPILPKMEGSDRVFTLRTVEDTFRIKSYIQQKAPQSVVLAGGGFISLELAENLRGLGLDVTIVQSGSQLMKPFDYDMAAFIHNEMRRNGVQLTFNAKVEKIVDTDKGVSVILDNGCSVKADIAIVAIGVVPDAELAKKAGLTLGIKGSILVNDKMQTSAQDIYAVGDAVQVKNYVTEKDDLIALAGPANKQGRIAADNICGLDSHFNGSQGSSIMKLFDLTVAATGINEQKARGLGFDTDSVILSPMLRHIRRRKTL